MAISTPLDKIRCHHHLYLHARRRGHRTYNNLYLSLSQHCITSNHSSLSPSITKEASTYRLSKMHMQTPPHCSQPCILVIHTATRHEQLASTISTHHPICNLHKRIDSPFPRPISLMIMVTLPNLQDLMMKHFSPTWCSGDRD